MTSLRTASFVALLALGMLMASTAVAEDDSSVDAHLDDARSLYSAGYWTDATEAFETAYENAPEGTKTKAASALEWGTLLWEQGSYAEAKRLVNEALELARELGLDDATGELLSTLGHIEAAMGNLSAAASTLEACIQITDELSDDVHRALCRLNRRNVRELQGKDPGPEEEFRADLNTLDEADSAVSTGVSLTKTATLYRDSDDLDRAYKLLEQAGDIFRESGSVPAQLRNRLRLAQVEHRRGNFEQATELTDGLLDRFQDMQNRPMIVHTRGLIAERAIHEGDASRALDQYRRALSTAQKIDNPQLTGRTHLAICEMNVGESPGHCGRAAGIFETTGMTFLEIRARSAHGRTLQNQRQFEDSRTQYRRAINQLKEAVDTDDGPYARTLAIQKTNLCQVNAELGTSGGYGSCAAALDQLEHAEDIEDDRPGLTAAAQEGAARTAAQADRDGDAIEHFGDAADSYADLDESRHTLRAADLLLRAGALQLATDDRDGAATSFQRGIELTEELDTDDSDVASTRVSLKTQLAQLHLNANDWSDAIDRLEALADTAEKLDHQSEAAWAYSGLANAYLQTDRRDDAIEALETGLPLAEAAGDEDLVDTLRNNLDELSD